ncbi:MAG: 4Fe-4S dicluster domain-containing protein [Nitrospirota bacterium]
MKKSDKTFNMAAIERCINCRGCEHDCPSFITLDSYDPTKVNRDILEGNIEPWIESEMIWQCLECHTCTEMCPQSYSWEKVLTTLKSMAMERGIVPKTVAKGMDTFIKTGRLGEPRDSVRQKMGLPPSLRSGIEDFKKIMELVKG